MWVISLIALQMPQFARRLSTLGDLHPLKELRELRFHTEDQII
jgi:hypothetical protein